MDGSVTKPTNIEGASAIASAEEKKGIELMQQAEAALKRFSWFGLANSTKTEDAIALYTKAANYFKMAQKWQLAGDAFTKCADLDMKNGSPFEASNHYIDAADMYKRIDASGAIKYYLQGITIMCDNGRFGTAAKHSEAIAELYEKDNNIPEALRFYQQAADYYSADNSSARANKNLEKVAELSATVADYKRAMEVFEQLGKSSLESNLLKFNAKKHFLHAGICCLARNDFVAAKNCVERYGELDYTFGETREGKLLSSLVDCCEEYNIDTFADVLFSYDSISKLSPWETSILLRVKNSLQAQADDAPDLH